MLDGSYVLKMEFFALIENDLCLYARVTYVHVSNLYFWMSDSKNVV